MKGRPLSSDLCPHLLMSKAITTRFALHNWAILGKTVNSIGLTEACRSASSKTQLWRTLPTTPSFSNPGIRTRRFFRIFTTRLWRSTVTWQRIRQVANGWTSGSAKSTCTALSATRSPAWGQPRPETWPPQCSLLISTTRKLTTSPAYGPKSPQATQTLSVSRCICLFFLGTASFGWRCSGQSHTR